MEIEDYFNEALNKTMATVDIDGRANLCPCGTAIMKDGKIIIGCIGIERSKSNISRHKNATFMVHNPINNEHWRQYEKVGELPYSAGYRLYCTFIEETQEEELLKQIRERIIERVGERCAGKLASAIIFAVDEVRAIRF